jgi:C_GCAxxG_C_C family probable redox protein
MTETELVERAQALFLENEGFYGCSEATLMTLLDAFGSTGELDPSVAMGLNGGVAYSGEICGAISGAAVAFGSRAASLEPDHLAAKRRARAATARLIEQFRAEFGSIRCRDLSGYDLSSQEKHDAFMASGVWKTVCMRQIEFAVTRAVALVSDDDPAASVSAQQKR